MGNMHEIYKEYLRKICRNI